MSSVVLVLAARAGADVGYHCRYNKCVYNRRACICHEYYRSLMLSLLSLLLLLFIHSFMALPSAQDRSEDGNESVSLERSETYPSNKLVL